MQQLGHINREAFAAENAAVTKQIEDLARPQYRAAAAETPSAIANILGQAGVPVAAARVLADIIATMRSCIDTQAGMIHFLQERVNALDAAPHMRREKRG